MKQSFNSKIDEQAIRFDFVSFFVEAFLQI